MDGIQAREPQTGRMKFAELSVVRLLHGVKVEGRSLPLRPRHGAFSRM
jgi:hypothetical protein